MYFPRKLTTDIHFLFLLIQGNNDGEAPLLEWLRSATQISKIDDLTSSWNDGVNLSALVDYCQPGLIPDHASLDPERRLENVKRAMEQAEQHLQIPPLMQPEDLAVDKPDKLSTMTYLSQFCCPNSVGERTLLEFLRKKLPKHNITNFTTDWVDGRLIGALTAALCVYEPSPSLANPTERCGEAMAAAETHLFARKIFETSEFINPELDRRLRMAYLTDLQRASQPPRLLDTHTPEVVGAGQEIVVKVETPEKGELEVSAEGALTGKVGVKIEPIDGGVSLVKISVPTRDRYTVTITHLGRVIRGCPFVVTLDAYSVPISEIRAPKKVGEPCQVIFDTSQVNGRSIEVKVSGKVSHEVEYTMQQTASGSHSLSFTPHCRDTFTVSLSVEGRPVRGSPYEIPLIQLVEPDLVKCGELQASEVGSLVSLTVDCTEAGKGSLTASCITQQNGEVPVSIITTDNGTPTAVKFTPLSSDLYLLRVLYEGGEVPGSPWSIDFRNLPPLPGKVTVASTPSGMLEVGKLLTVKFDAVNAGSGKLTATCSGTMCGNFPVSIATIGLGKYTVGFVPTVPDNYFITVCWAGTQVHGSPFQISFGREPVNHEKVRLEGLTGNPSLVKVRGGYQALLGRQLQLQVKTHGAGEAKLEVKVRSPSKETLLTPQSTAEDSKIHVICYTPLMQGQHSIHLLWGGTPVQNSPVKFTTLSPETFPLGGPISIELEVDGKKKDLNGEAVFQKEGLPEKVMATVEQASNKKVVLSLDPDTMQPGTYVLYVYSKFKELPGSPIVLVYGVDESEREEDTAAVAETDSGSASVKEIRSEETAPASQEKAEEVSVAVETCVETSELVTESLSSVDPHLASSGIRERSFTTDDPPHSRVQLLRTEQRSQSVGKRPEFSKTTTPVETEMTFELPEGSHESPPIEEQQSLGLQSSPPVGDAAPTVADVPVESAYHPEPHDNQLVKEVAELEREARDSDIIEIRGELPSQERKDESEKEKKKTEDKVKLKREKEREKAEKAEKAKREKEEKKKKKERKKEGGLNLEDQEFRVGIKMKYKLHCDALGSKPPSVICDPPEAAKHAIVPAPQFGKNTYWCELTPTQVGKLEISLVYEDFHILGSPFLVSVNPRGDAAQCTMVETSSTCKQELQGSLLFCIGVPETAGKGKLTASVKTARGSKRLTGVRTMAATEHHYHIEFVPSEGLEYVLSVKYDERHIKGSPFIINLGDPTKCKVHGEGIKQAQVEEDNVFAVDATEAGPGELSVKIECEGKLVDHKVTVTGDKSYRISYAAVRPGVYLVAVLWGEGHVRNSPFRVPCISASQFTIAENSLHRMYAGALSSFQVATKALHMRQKQLSVFVHPANDISKMFSGEIVRTDDGGFTCLLRPTEAHIGPCKLHICWNGKEIQGSPHEINVEAPPPPTEFSLVAVETESGDIAVDVSGPTDVFASDNVVATVENIFTGEQVPAKVTKVSNERSRIQLLPMAGGEYQLSLLYAGYHVASSPFVLTQADPTQCVVSGEGVRVSRVGELSKFTVDHSKAGLGHLRVDIEGEGGKTVDPFIASGESLSEVSYISKELGVYKIFLRWGEYEFPHSPFTMYTVDPAKFTVEESLPKRLSTNKALQFTVKTSGGVEEWERVSVTAKLIHQQKVYRGTVEPRKRGRETSYSCSLEIPQEGQYAVYVQCRGLDVQGSPFKVKMMPSPRPEQVTVSGLESGVVGRKMKFTIDTSEAGYGHVGLKVQGPKSGGTSIDMHRHQSLQRVVIAEYTPDHPGRYTIHVSWAGLPVPGSPYSVLVFSKAKQDEPDNHTRDWVRQDNELTLSRSSYTHIS